MEGFGQIPMDFLVEFGTNSPIILGPLARKFRSYFLTPTDSYFTDDLFGTCLFVTDRSVQLMNQKSLSFAYCDAKHNNKYSHRL